jgi:hypothetical protein
MVVIPQRNTEHRNRLSYCRETQNTVSSWSMDKKTALCACGHPVGKENVVIRRSLYTETQNDGTNSSLYTEAQNIAIRL